MRSKYIPNRYAGRKCEIGERVTAIALGSLMIAVSPVYIIEKGIAKVKEYIRREEDSSPSTNEFVDTFKWCLSSIVNGRLPDRK